MNQSTLSERALVLAPRGRDAAIAIQLMRESGIDARSIGTLKELIHELNCGAAFVIITEESLATAEVQPLSDWISTQEEWSDLPFILLTNKGGLERNPAAARHLELLGNVTFLERPFHPTTLTSLARSSVRARRRQYEARSRLFAMRDSEQRFRTLFEAMDEGFAVIEFIDGPDGPLSDYVHIQANPAYLTNAGIPDIVGKRLREIVSESEADGWADIYRRVLETGEAVRFERELVETGRHLDLAAFRIGAADQRQVAVLFKDISERKQAEAALRESEERFRLTADAVPQIVWITDADGKAEFFNKQWLDYTGASEQPSSAGQVAESFVHPDDAVATMVAFDEARRTQTTYLVEHRIRSATGEYRWFLVRGEPYRDPLTDRIVRWFGASVDIHELKRAEASLRELNETLEAQVAARSAERDRLWNLSQDMLARADYTGMMSAVSPAWTWTLGWTEKELLSRAYASFMHPDDAPPTLEAIAKMAETGEPARFENRIARKDGDWTPIEWTVSPEPDSSNFIAIGRDLTLAKAREADLEAAQEALRQSQKMEAMGTLTGGVAHDFNNLLTPIVGALDMLVRRGVGSQRERRLIDGALQSAERATVLVQRLLAFARRQPLQAVAVDLVVLINGMADLVGSTLGPNIQVNVDIPANLPPAKVDPNQLEMALLNLAVNARDAMPSGGQLTIAAKCQSVTDDNSSGLKQGQYICLSVEDTGLGMDEETLGRAIEPFFSTKGIGKGTGLGLSMVHGLAAQLGGGLTIESAPARGTRIDLWLPLSEEAVSVQSAEPAEVRARVSRGIALLVEDEILVRMSTADMLMDFGFEVVETGSAEAALEFIHAGLAPDLLITDHLMPGMNGADLAFEVRKLRPSLPVLIVSGYAEGDGLASDLPRLTKPFRNAELRAAIFALLPDDAE